MVFFLVEFVSEAINVVERGHQLDAVYTDVRKAFDRIGHKAQICKLEELGVHSLHRTQSYLSDRHQYVKVMGWKSQLFRGPLLFLLYFNDVTRVIKSSKSSLCADDLIGMDIVTSAT